MRSNLGQWLVYVFIVNKFGRFSGRYGQYLVHFGHFSGQITCLAFIGELELGIFD